MTPHNTETFAATVFDWDGEHLPDIFRELPPGKYLVRWVEDVTPTPGNEPGLVDVAESPDRGERLPLEEVMGTPRRRSES